MDKLRSTADRNVDDHFGRPSRWFLALMLPIGIGVVLLLLLAWKNPWRTSSQPPEALAEATVPGAPAGSSSSPGSDKVPRRFASKGPVATRMAAPDSPGVAQDPTEEARFLIETLTSIDPATEPLTTESIRKCQESLVSLVNLNVDAIPALEEFFASGQDVNFGPGPATNLVNAPTLRLAFIRALLDFTAPDNEQFQARLLQTVSDPDEVLLLARQLAVAVPGEYHDIILQAAKTSLESVRHGPYAGRDPTPLLKLISKYETSERPRQGL